MNIFNFARYFPNTPKLNPKRIKMNKSCAEYIRILNRLNIQLYDVSLRDGIQSAVAEYMTTNRKKDIFHEIMRTHCPSRIEVGSLSSPKVLPVMRDSMYMYEYSKSMIVEKYSSHLKPPTQTLLLIPGISQLKYAVNNNVDGVSFIASVSEAFQVKNTKKTLDQTRHEIHEMCRYVKEHAPRTYMKLYLSCINECPLRGFVQNDIVVDEMMSYAGLEVDEICMSDTCGTLTAYSLRYIVNTCVRMGLPVSKLSLHLHVFPETRDEVVEMLFFCLDKGINKFDVSILETGGCSVTMGENVRPNISYDLFYDIVHQYILERKSKQTDII